MKNVRFVILQIVVLAEQLQWTKSEKKNTICFDFQSKLGPYQLNHIFLIMNLLSDNSHIGFEVLQP